MLLVASLAACSSISGGRKIEYKSASSRSELEIPPDLSSLPPSQDAADAATFSGYSATKLLTRPGAGRILPTYKTVALKRFNGQRWLVVNEKPEKIWPQLREFIFGVGLSIARENKITGVIETDWAENRAGLSRGGWATKLFNKYRDTGMRDKYRFRVEEGKKSGTSDVYLTHQGLEEIVVSGGGDAIELTRWQRRRSDLELEAEMLRLLMNHLGVKDAKARSMLLAGMGRARVTLAFDTRGVAQMQLTDDFGSAWRRVNKALDRVGAKIKKKDRNKGMIALTFHRTNSRKKPGFISRMFGGGKKQAQQYRLRVSAASKGSEVKLLHVKKDRQISNADGKRFMKSLFEELR